MSDLQWIKGDWRAPNGGYYNADNIVAIGVGTYGPSNLWATFVYIAQSGGLTEPQYLFVYTADSAGQDNAQEKATELAQLTGAIAS